MPFTQMQRSCVSRMTMPIGRRLGSGSLPGSDSTPVPSGARGGVQPCRWPGPPTGLGRPARTVLTRTGAHRCCDRRGGGLGHGLTSGPTVRSAPQLAKLSLRRQRPPAGRRRTAPPPLRPSSRRAAGRPATIPPPSPSSRGGLSPRRLSRRPSNLWKLPFLRACSSVFPSVPPAACSPGCSLVQVRHRGGTPVGAGVRIEDRRLTPAATSPSGGDCSLAGTRTLCVSGRHRLRRRCSQVPRTAPRTGATR